jgi:hypothetical protein
MLRGLPGTLGLILLLFAVSWPRVWLHGETLVPWDLVRGMAGFRSGAAPAPPPVNDLLSDPAYQFYPWRTLTAELLRRGEPPLWNRWNGCGQPLLANFQSAPFDPTALPFLALPAPHAWTLQLLLRLLLAGGLTFLLGRTLGLGVSGARLAALVYAWGGTMLASLEWPQAAVAAWLPGLVLGAELLARAPTPRRAALFAVVLALAALGGHPETLLFCATAAAAWLWVRARGRRPAAAAHGALAGALAALLAAPVLLPFLDHLPLTRRFQLFSSAPMTAGMAYPLEALLAVFCPGLFGGSYGYVPPVNPILLRGLFAGGTAVVLAAVALARPHPARAPLAWGAALALLIACDTPLHHFAVALPLFRYGSLTGFAIPAVLALALLGGLGLGALPGAPRRGPGLFGLALGLVALLWLALRVKGLEQAGALAGAVVALAGFAAVVAVVAWRRAGPRVLVAVAAVELFLAGRGSRGTVPASEVFAPNAWTAALAAAPGRTVALPEGGGVSFTGVLPNALLPRRIEDAGFYDPVYPPEVRELFEATGPTGVLDYLRPGSARPHLLDALGVRWLLAPRPHAPRTLLDRLLEEGLRDTPDPRFLERGSFELPRGRREVLFDHAPAAVELRLAAAPRAVRFRAAVSPAVLREAGDGVGFVVEAGRDDPGTVLLARLIDPKRRAGDRRWFDERVDLGRWAGRTVRLALRVSPGPDGNNAFDLGAWGAPRIGGRALDPSALARAPRRAGGPHYVQAGSVNVAGDERPALLMHAESEVELAVEVPADEPELRVGLALPPEVWAPERGDGVLFEAIVRAEPELGEVWRGFLDPAREAGDREGRSGSADLSALGPGPVRLRFRTEPGPAGNDSYDHGGWAELALDPPDETAVAEDGGVTAVRRATALPEAYLVHDWIAGGTREEARARMVSGATDLRSVAFLEGVAPPPASACERPPGRAARVVERTDREVLVEAEAAAPGWLVLLDSWSPGWEAWVDGVRAPIARANHCFRAVPLRPGRHAVWFVYRPRAWRIGLALAAVGAVLLALTAASRRGG